MFVSVFLLLLTFEKEYAVVAESSPCPSLSDDERVREALRTHRRGAEAESHELLPPGAEGLPQEVGDV